MLLYNRQKKEAVILTLIKRKVAHHMPALTIKTLSIFYSLCAILFALWSIPAVYFLTIFSNKSYNLVLMGFYIALLLLLFFIPQYKIHCRIIRFSLFLIILIAWQQLTPTHNKPWADSISQLPSVTLQDKIIHIQNIRDFIYQSETDYTINYIDKTYQLSDLTELDYILSFWDNNEAIAHTMFSFGFKNGEHLVISVEVRHKKGEEYGGFAGLYKQFELIYVLATERDILQLRTNFRQEEVYRYPVNLPQAIIQKLFNIVIARANDLYETPEFYNTLSHNCFTSLATDFWSLGDDKTRLDYRMLANGFSDEMLYERGRLKSKLSFADTKKKSYINQYIEPNIYNPHYSKQIRPKTN